MFSEIRVYKSNYWTSTQNTKDKELKTNYIFEFVYSGNSDNTINLHNSFAYDQVDVLRPYDATSFLRCLNKTSLNKKLDDYKIVLYSSSNEYEPKLLPQKEMPFNVLTQMANCQFNTSNTIDFIELCNKIKEHIIKNTSEKNYENLI